MKDKIKNLKSLAGSKKKENKKFFASLNTAELKNLDGQFQELHEEVFAYTDCLQCANCCKTIGPKFNRQDIERISGHLKIRPAEFHEKYLREDEDHDIVLQQLPCPFLEADNRCRVYDVRPKACREYPHTDQRGQTKMLPLTLKNMEVCPAVYDMVELLKAKMK